MIGTIIESQGMSHLHSDDWQRTIYIDTLGVGTTEFDLSETKKKKLEESGTKCAKAYFKWYDNADNKPVNSP